MPAQLSLDGFDNVVIPSDRLFFTLFPPPEVAQQIASQARQLKTRNSLAGKLLKTERLHVTLIHLGDYAGVPADMVASAQEAASRLVFKPFTVRFERVASFGGRRDHSPYVLLGGATPMTELMAFRQDLHKALETSVPRFRPERQFTPHVTLLYDRKETESEAVEPIEWTVSEFHLVHSLLGQSIYLPLGTWNASA